MDKHEIACCKVDAVVSVDSKGQIVLPKEVREKMNLKPDSKLALIGYERGGEICCLIVIRAEELGNTVSKMLGPMLKDITK